MRKGRERNARKDPFRTPASGAVPRGPASGAAANASRSMTGRVLGLGAFGKPLADDIDLFGWPGSVAGHRSLAQLSDDGVAVSGNVSGGPEIEGLAHGSAVALAEQWLDVALEAQGIIRHGDRSSLYRLCVPVL